MPSSSPTSRRRKRRGPEDKEGKASAAVAAPTPQAAEERSLFFGAVLLPQESGLGKVLAAILAVSFSLRAFNLLGMFPVLVDESIYMRWVEIIDHQGQWLISLLDGKPPLSYWLLALVRMTFGGDPLWQARLVSALVGLLSTWCVFAIARRIASKEIDDRGGLLAAALYAIFPWALVYDRLAYTEAFVNLFGLLTTLAAIVVFSREGSWKTDALAGLALGLGLFTKQTVILFALVPAAAAFFLARGFERNWIARLAAVYAVGAAFLGLNAILTPSGPTLASHDVVLHHTGFFAQPDDLLADPFFAARANAPILLGFIGKYLTWPLVAAAAAAAVWMARRGGFAPWLLLTASVAPLLAETFLLDINPFPTRYPFPHTWPWLAVVGAGATAWLRTRSAESRGVPPLAVAAIALIVFGPLAYRAGAMLSSPRDGLHSMDTGMFLGDSGHVGFGVREAVEFLKQQAFSGPYVLLTDPVWGTPSDAMPPYLNERYGIRVFEAWWTQLSPTHEILPRGEAEVLKSHYERVSAGKINFAELPRVLYVTDTNYYPKDAVKIRQPNAKLLASFPKPGKRHSIDVYQLK